MSSREGISKTIAEGPGCNTWHAQPTAYPCSYTHITQLSHLLKQYNMTRMPLAIVLVLMLLGLVSIDATRCGVDWEAAYKLCSNIPCDENDEPCPDGEKCFRVAAPDPCTPNRCGKSWEDANENCGNTKCGEDDALCPEGQSCFKEVVPCGKVGRCGTSWDKANADCKKATCYLSAQCADGEACYADVQDTCDE